MLSVSQPTQVDHVQHDVGSVVPVASRQGRDNQRFATTGERLVAGYGSVDTLRVNVSDISRFKYDYFLAIMGCLRALSSLSASLPAVPSGRGGRTCLAAGVFQCALLKARAQLPVLEL
jgi:hypothetical protein